MLTACQSRAPQDAARNVAEVATLPIHPTCCCDALCRAATRCNTRRLPFWVLLDLYHEDGTDGDGARYLALPIELAYESDVYPNGNLLTFSELPVRAARAAPADFDL